MYINEYFCNECESKVKIVLDGVNSENVHCPFCRSDDVDFMDHEQLT
jgi:uncharacterized protein YlaI